MPDKIYGFAGMKFRFRADESIVTTARFEDFLRSDGENCVTVDVVRSSLPEKHGGFCRVDERRELYSENGKEMLFSAYFEQRQRSYRDFACREDTPGGFRLYVDFDGELTDLMLFEALYVPGVLARCGMLILHSSFVVHNGEAVVFAGVKQVGKTTQALLWQKHLGAQVVNGDRTALKITDGRLYAVGVPFCGSSDISADRTAPVRAVVFPSIAEKTEIIKRSGSGVFMDILQLLTYNRQSVEETALASDIAAFIAQSGRAYSMPCTPDGETVRLLEKELFAGEG